MLLSLTSKGGADKFLNEALIFDLGVVIGHLSELQLRCIKSINFSFDFNNCSGDSLVDFEKVNAGCLSTSTLTH